MSAVPASTISQLRRLVPKLAYPDHYRVVRETRTADGAGGSTVTTDYVEEGPCLLKVGTTAPDERALAERRGWQTPYVIVLRHDTTLTPGDRVEVNGRTFEVGGVLVSGSWGVVARAVCEERDA